MIQIIHGIALLLIGGCVIHFIWKFALPSWQIRKSLTTGIARLEGIKQQREARIDPSLIERDAMVSDALKHCWAEYRDTLHPQKTVDAEGNERVACWRATAMAGSFFTPAALVEGPAQTEYFKHLPGILTGIGIIATFSGLILGLSGFEIDPNNTQATQQSLSALIQTVGAAFWASGAAILFAMFVTAFEKMTVNGLMTRVETLCGLIDSLFDSGAGEEYLQRLVEAAETSATQAMQMKESLVTDLKQVLTELTQQQIASIQNNGAQISQSISTTLTEGLRDPLERISSAVSAVGSSQGDAVNRMLTDVLTQFSTRMEGMFGSQMRGMNDMLAQTASTIQAASSRFDELAQRLEQAGAGATGAMSRQVEDMMQRMNAQQDAAHQQMLKVLEELQGSSKSTQDEASRKTLELVDQLSRQSEALMAKLQEQHNEAAQKHAQQQAAAAELQARQQAETSEKFAQEHAKATQQASQAVSAFLQQSQNLIRESQTRQQEAQAESDARQAALGDSLQAAVRQQSELMAQMGQKVSDAAQAMENSVRALERVTTTAVSGLGEGATRIDTAATRMSGAIDGVSDAADSLQGTALQLSQASSQLGQSSTSLQQALLDHRVLRENITHALGEIRGIIDAARKDGAVVNELMDGLRSAGLELNQAQTSARSFIQELTAVMEQAHVEFAKNVERTLSQSNSTFHAEMARAVGSLKDAIEDLTALVESMPSQS